DFSFNDLAKITGLGRGEIRECVRRGIISAETGVGQGHHRRYSRWNLVEGVIAASIIRSIRAGGVEQIVKNIRSAMRSRRIGLEECCASPKRLFMVVSWSNRPLTGSRRSADGAAPMSFRASDFLPDDAEGNTSMLVIDLRAAAERVNELIRKLA